MGVSDWDRGRPARPERVTERSGVQRSQPHITLKIEETLLLPGVDS